MKKLANALNAFWEREGRDACILSLPYVSITYLFSSFATKALPGLEGAEDKRGHDGVTERKDERRKKTVDEFSYVLRIRLLVLLTSNSCFF